MGKSQITIVGAGIPGLSLALILAKSNFAVTIIDKYKLPVAGGVKPSARTSALMQGSLEILSRTGIWPDFQNQCTALETLSIIDDSVYPRGAGDMIREDFKALELDLTEFGYNVPLIDLTSALAELARKHGDITIMDGVEIDQNHNAITDADLVVGADGRNSIVRKWSNINTTVKKYDQTAITCVISHTLTHNNTSIEFHRSGGPCTFVPHGEGQSAVVWVEKTKDVTAFLKLSRDEFIRALQDRTRGLLGQIDLVVEPESWPLMTLKANQLTAPKTVLIAEAAHVLSPIGAQGLNLSLRDVGALADILINAHDLGCDIGNQSILKSYERNRRRDVVPRHFGVDMLNQMVANDNVFVRGLRRFGLHAIRHIKPIRKILMEHGLSARS